MKQPAYTFEQWNAAIGDVAIQLEHMGWRIDPRLVGLSTEYRFAYRDTAFGSLQITPSAAGASLTFYFPTIEVPASGIYDDPEADQTAGQRKERIEQAIAKRAHELFGENETEEAKATDETAPSLQSHQAARKERMKEDQRKKFSAETGADTNATTEGRAETTGGNVKVSPVGNDASVAMQEPPKREPTLKTKLRAETFKRLKDAHPEWGYDTVALRAAEEMKDNGITGSTVRNAYKAMGWKWGRSDRIR